MKKLLIIGFAILLSSSINAQKFGHVNSSEIVDLLVKTKGVIEKLEARDKMYSEALLEQQNTFQKDLQEYQNNMDKYSDAQKEMEEQLLMKTQQTLIEREKEYNQKYQEYQQELMAPKEKDILDAIEKVAEKGKYTYILDTRTLLFAKESEDISNLVKKELGM